MWPAYRTDTKVLLPNLFLLTSKLLLGNEGNTMQPSPKAIGIKMCQQYRMLGVGVERGYRSAQGSDDRQILS